MAPQLPACHCVPPLYHHRDWRLSGLGICNSGSASTPGISHPCTSLGAPASSSCVFYSGYRFGIFARLAEGSCSSFGRLLKIRKSWPRTSGEWRLREKRCSRTVTAAFGSSLLALLLCTEPECPREVPRTSEVPRPSELPAGQPGAHPGVCRCWCASGGGLPDTRRGLGQGISHST